MAVAELIQSKPMSQDTLIELQRLLERLHGAASDIAAVASARDLKLLQQAVTTLCSHPQDAQRSDADTYATSSACEAVSKCLELLTQQLQEPCADLYSSNGGPPCETPVELQIPGSIYQEVLVAKLQLLRLLLQQVGHIELTPPSDQQQEAAAAAARKDDSRARNRPSYVVGIVEITEEDDNGITATAEQQHQAQLQRLSLQAILVCALYASSLNNSICSSSDDRESGLGDRPAPAGEAAGNSNSSQGSSRGDANSSSKLQSLDDFCDSVMQQGLELFTPWSSRQCQQHAQQLLQQIAGNIVVAGRNSAATGNTSPAAAAAATAGGGSTIVRDDVSKLAKQLQRQARIQLQESDKTTASRQQQQQQGIDIQQQWQELLVAVLPQLLDCLRDTVLAQHRHKKLQDKGNLVPYKGPDTFHRCLAARQLAYIIQYLSNSSLTPETCGLLLPLVLATADDPAPAVQQYGHAMLGWMAVQGPAGCLTWQRVLLLDEAKRLVVGCEESCWRSAMPAATNLVTALEGKHNVRSAGYHTLVQELLTEAQRSAQQPNKRLIFMACMAQLIPCLRLYIVRYFAQLMPLLLEWTHAFDEDTAVVAVQLLSRIVQYAWPRMEVHAAVLWEHLVEVARAADERTWMNNVGFSKDSNGVSDRLLVALVQLVGLLKQCGGKVFKEAVEITAVEVAKDGGGCELGFGKSVKQLLLVAGVGIGD